MADNDTDVRVQMARIEERLKIVTETLIQDRESRKNQYEKTEELSLTIHELNGRIKNVEEGLAKSAPTIEEFITIKHKVVGAGVAGRWIWVAGGVLLTLLVSFRAEIFKWLSK